MRKTINPFIIILVVFMAGFLAYQYWWLPRQAVINPEKLIGGDKDEHGCLIAAGYSWCEARQKCLRTWEEECLVGDPFLFVEIGNLVKEGGNWFLVYEKPGALALMVNLVFNNNSVCDFGSGDEPCSLSKINVGDRTRVEGGKGGSSVTVSKLTITK